MQFGMATPGFSSTGNVLGSGIYAAAGTYGYWNVDFETDSSTTSTSPKIDVDAPSVSNPKTLPPADELSPEQLQAIQVLYSFITVVEIALLYEAALNREPDIGGLNYWYDRAAEDLTTKDISQALLASPEFAKNFGNPAKLNNDQFVTTLYTNVLDRAPEPAGKAFWVQQLSSGMSRADVLGNIAVSPENSSAAHYLETLGFGDSGWYF